MRRSAPVIALAVTLLAVTAPVLGAVVTFAPGDAAPDSATPAESGATAAADARAETESTNNSSVEVGTGSQLSTVLSTTETDIDTAVSRSAFESAFQAANETERAELVVERATELQSTARAITDEYREATRALRNGTLNRSAYAQELATLNARGRNVLSSITHLLRRAANVSALELQAAGFNRSALADAAADLDAVTGAGPGALLQRYMARSNASVSIETTGAVSIEVTNENGERNVEVTRDGDENRSLSLTQSEALAIARGALSTQSANWTLQETSVEGQSGHYEFEFGFTTANLTGEGEVRVDGSSGTIVRLEEEIEPREERDESEPADPDDRADRTDTDRGDRDGTLTLLVVSGEPAPNATVTLEARLDGQPAANVAVFLDGERVGTTGPEGTIDVTLSGARTKVEAEKGDAEDELEFEFENETDDAEQVLRDLNVSASLTDGTVSVSVTYRGDAVRGAQVAADGDRVGTTGGDGLVIFPLGNDTEELEVTITKGRLELERTYRVDNGSLAPGEADDGDSEQGRDETGDRRDTGEEETDAGNLSLHVVSGEPAPNATVTLEARLDGEPAANVTVFVEGERVGTTDAEGTIEVTLTGEDTKIEAEKGEAEAEREFEFETGDDSESGEDSGTETPDETGNLSLHVVSGEPAPNAIVTLEARLDGEQAANVTVFVEGERVGTTDAEGTIEVTLTGEDTKVEAEKGDAEAERRFRFETDEADSGTDSGEQETANEQDADQN